MAQLFKHHECPNCKGTYYQRMIGEDGAAYLIPFKPKFCPHCGRKIR